MRIGNPVNGRLHNEGCSGETHCFQRFIYSEWVILILLWLEWPEALESKGLWRRPPFLKELGYLPVSSLRDHRWHWDWGLSYDFFTELSWAKSQRPLKLCDIPVPGMFSQEGQFLGLHTECPVPLHLRLVCFLCVAQAQWSLLFSPVAQQSTEKWWKHVGKWRGSYQGSRRVVRGGRFRPLDEPYEWCMRVLQA